MPDPVRTPLEIVGFRPLEIAGPMRPIQPEDPSKTQPFEQPSAKGFGRNVVTSAGGVVGGMVGMGMKAMSQNPVTTVKDLAHGIVDRAGQYRDDMHPRDAWDRLKEGSPIQALGSLLPSKLLYDDPSGVAADVAGGKTLAELPGQILRAPGRILNRGGGPRGPAAPSGPGGTTFTPPREPAWPMQNEVADFLREQPGARTNPFPAAATPEVTPGGFWGDDRPPVQVVEPPVRQQPTKPPPRPETPSPEVQVDTNPDMMGRTADLGGDPRQGDGMMMQNRPDLTPVGGEAEFNAGRPATPMPDVEESAFEAMKQKLGMSQDNPNMTMGQASAESDSVFSPEAVDPLSADVEDLDLDPSSVDEFGDWHSGAEPGSPDAEAASKLHRYEAEMDQGYRRRLSDEKGSMDPFLLGVLADYAARQIGIPAARGTARAGIKAAKFMGPKVRDLAMSPAGKAAAEAGVVARFMGNKGKEDK